MSEQNEITNENEETLDSSTYDRLAQYGIRAEKGQYYDLEGKKIETVKIGDKEVPVQTLVQPIVQHVTGKRTSELERKYTEALGEKIREAEEKAKTANGQKLADLKKKINELQVERVKHLSAEDRARAMENDLNELKSEYEKIATEKETLASINKNREIEDDINRGWNHKDVAAANLRPNNLRDFHRELKDIAVQRPVLNEDNEETGEYEYRYPMDVEVKRNGIMRREKKEMTAGEILKHLSTQPEYRHWFQGANTTGSGDINTTFGGSKGFSNLDPTSMSQKDYEQLRKSQLKRA